MKRLSSGLLAGIIALLMTLAIPVLTSADTPAGTPSTPAGLTMTRLGGSQPLTPGAWINQGKLDLHFQVQVNTGALTPQIEIIPSSTAFTGTPTASGAPVNASGMATVTASGLRNGTTYHWQARVVDGGGQTSAWVPFGATVQNSDDVGVDLAPPSRPVITSPSDPNQNRFYNTNVEVLRWKSRDAISGIAGYTYKLERHAHVIPAGPISAENGVRISHLADGTWFLALRSVDRAGNWSPTATFKLHLDHQAPRLTWLSPRRFTYDPYRGSTLLRFRVSENASARLSLYRVGAHKPIAVFSFPSLRGGQVASLTWNGKNRRGHIVKKGYYFFAASIVDRADNLARFDVGGIVVDPLQPLASPAGPVVYPDGGKRIIVSLSRQTLYAYDGDKLVLQTYVTTGNPSLPTPPGHYTILEKIHPFEFISPWPEGSPYYYAPSWVQYAMLFRQGGYFLHDAPWRSAFGPGTNGPGQPGTNYGGSHGCVNMPIGPTVYIWNWAPIGTAVDVVP